MKDRVQALVYIGVVWMTFFGCVKQESLPDPPVPSPGGEVTVTLKLNMEGPEAATRSLSAADEEQVREIDLLVFDKEDRLADWQLGQLKNEGEGVSFSVRLKSSKDDNDRYRLMVLANSRDATYELFKLGAFESLYLGMSYTELYPKLWSTLSADPAQIQERGIPMWAEFKDPVVISGTHANYTMTLIKSLVRIDVGTNRVPTVNEKGEVIWAVHPNFSLEEVLLYNVPDTYMHLPGEGNYDFTNKRVTDFSLPPSPYNTKFTTPLIFSDEQTAGTVTRVSGKGVSVTSTVYIPEANIKMGGTYGDAQHVERTALVVGGYYSPDPSVPNTSVKSYYRIDFTMGTNSYTLHDLLRNSCYQVVIRNVSGPGSEDPTTAFQKFDTDLTATILTWTPAHQASTVVDGQNYLSVDRFDIVTDKWAKSDEEIAVSTNLTTTWKATVTEGGDWLTLSGGAAVTGFNGDTFRFNVTEIPLSVPERIGKVKVSLGKMSLFVIIRQTNTDDEFRLRITTSELLFSGRQWNEVTEQWEDPSVQTIGVDWASPAHDYEMALASYVGGGVLGFAPPALSSNPEVSVGLAAIDGASQRVKDNPFYERSSILTFKAWNTDHTDFISKQVFLRQVFYSLLVQDTLDYYFQGNTHSFTIRSNTPWVADFSGDESIFASRSGVEGVGNTSAAGEKFTFTIAPGATPGATVKVTFRSRTGHLFPPRTVTIVAEDDQPNCYIQPPNGATISIPVRKAYRVWKNDRDLKVLHPNGDLPSGTKGATLIWQDAQSLIQSVSYRESGTTGYLDVRPNNAGISGNAVVAFTINGTVYWSWHIWVTGETITSQSFNEVQMMDRSLGALSTVAGTPGVLGMVYQGGRKDPLPLYRDFNAAAQSKPLYNIGNTPLGGVSQGVAPNRDGLLQTIRKPQLFLTGPYGTADWNGLLTTYRAGRWELDWKTDFDPCPKGWRIPKYTSVIIGKPQAFDAIGCQYLWNGLQFPAIGYIDVGGFYSNYRVCMTIWAVHNYAQGATPVLFATYGGSDLLTGSNSWAAFGSLVRCVRE